MLIKDIKAREILDSRGTPTVETEVILENGAKMLRPGGFLVYSTCTFSPEENEQVIGDFLLEHPDFSLVDTGKAAIDGEIVNMADTRELKTGKILIPFDVYDGSSTITCKIFAEADKSKNILKRLKNAKGVKIAGTVQFDPFAKELGVIANVIVETAGMKKIVRQDNSPVKRVELHMHTQMSQMDGMTSAKDLIKRAMKWGMKSIAITDHGVVQSFPEAHKLLGFDNPDMKVIYGVEAYLVPDKTPSVSFPQKQDIDTTYCVLDLETTGFSPVTDKITEIGIMKVQNGEVIDKFSCFVNPERPIPQRVVEVTNITDDMVKDAKTIEKVMPKIIDFVGDSVLVAHNADFDIGFLKHNAKELGYTLENTYMDTLKLAKLLFPDFKKYKLGMIPENPKLEKVICRQLEKNELTEEDLLNVNRLVVNGKYGRVKTLAGIERLKNLETLSIYPGNIKSLKPITNLTKLTAIGIARQNKLTDLQLIGKINTLTDISLRDMDIIDISFLENLKNLNDIYIADCGITNIDCLKDLNPEEVHLWDNNIESLPDLSNWTRIKKLDLSGNPITKNREITDENGDVYMSYFKKDLE